MMTEPQKLEFSTRDSPGPAIVASFPEYSKRVEIPVEKVLDVSTIYLLVSVRSI